MINGAAAGEDDKSLGWADWDVAGGKEERGGGPCWILAILHAVGLYRDERYTAFSFQCK